MDWSRLPDHVIEDFELWCNQHRGLQITEVTETGKAKRKRRRDRGRRRDRSKSKKYGEEGIEGDVVNDENRSQLANVCYSPPRFGMP